MVEKRFRNSKVITPTDCWAIGGGENKNNNKVRKVKKGEKIYHYRRIN